MATIRRMKETAYDPARRVFDEYQVRTIDANGEVIDMVFGSEVLSEARAHFEREKAGVGTDGVAGVVLESCRYIEYLDDDGKAFEGEPTGEYRTLDEFVRKFE